MMAVMMMVVSNVIILRIIHNSAKWRSTYANRASTQKRTESAKVCAFLKIVWLKTIAQLVLN